MDKNRNIYWIIAGAINLFTAVLHTIGGQLELVNPLMKSDLNTQEKAEWIGAWHMVTIILFFTSYITIKHGITNNANKQLNLIKYIGYLYLIFSIPSIITSVMYQLLAPQWILLLPISVLIYIGVKKQMSKPVISI